MKRVHVLGMYLKPQKKSVGTSTRIREPKTPKPKATKGYHNKHGYRSGR